MVSGVDRVVRVDGRVGPTRSPGAWRLLASAERVGRAGVAAALKPVGGLPQTRDLGLERRDVLLKLGVAAEQIGVAARQLGVGLAPAHDRRQPARA